MTKLVNTVRAKKGSNEYLFGFFKGHFFVAASSYELRPPQPHLIEDLASIQLQEWRALRKRTYQKMKNKKELAMIESRNLVEFGDAIGPTKAYFVDPKDDPTSSEWARRLIDKTIRWNGRAALERLAEERNAAMPPDSLFPRNVQPYVEERLIFQKSGDAVRPWAAEFNSIHLRVQVNLFPDEILYTVFRDGETLGDFNDWPQSWKR
jgi:hypothetical protein